MMQSLMYDVSFWLVVNFFLVAAVVGLVLIRQSLLKSAPKQTPPEQVKQLDEEISLFKSLSAEQKGREAVVIVFPRVLSAVCQTAAKNQKSMTAKEILESAKTPEPIRQLLTVLYNVYEPSRYGDAQPTTEDLKVFAETLEKLSEGLSKHV